MYLTMNKNFQCFSKENKLVFSSASQGQAFEIDDQDSVNLLRKLLSYCTGTIPVETIAKELDLETFVLMESISGLLKLKLLILNNTVHARIAIVSDRDPEKFLNLAKSLSLNSFCEVVELDQVPERTTCLVAVGDETNLSFFQAVERKASEMKVPWIRVSVDDPYLYFGPVFFQDGGPCFECFTERINRNASNVKQISHYGPIDHFIAPFLERELLKFLRETGPSSLFEREVILNIQQMESTSYRVFKVPGCKGCAQRGC